MGWATVLGPDMAQVDYRLREAAGCGMDAPGEHRQVDDGEDRQLAYHLDAGDRALEWIGEGLRDVGLTPGEALDEDGKAAARMLANGRDPRSREQLVKPKQAVDPRGKLPASVMVAAVEKAAADAGVTPEQLLAGDGWAARRYARLCRGVDRQGEAHKVPVGELERVAKAAGVGPLEELYDGDQLATARRYAGERVRVGNRGYDVTLDLPKSYSVLFGLADADVAQALEDTYLQAVREGVAALEGWVAYGQRGHHGDGQVAERVASTGLLGWLMVHRTARSVTGQAPDPHLHVHVTLMNLVHGTDGKWSAVAGGGRDILRHAHTVDALVKARLRALTAERFGLRWDRDDRTGEWEVVGVPAELRGTFSKRANQVADTLEAFGLDAKTATRAQQKTAGEASREGKQRPDAGGDLRGAWRTQAVAEGHDPGRVVRDALGDDGTGRTSRRPPGPGPRPLTPEQIAARVFDPEHGLTAHTKVVTRADVLAAVAEALPAGVDTVAQLEQLVDQVLAVGGHAVRLPDGGQGWQSNAARYTTADIVDAERTVLAAARDRHSSNTAVVPPRVLAAAIDVHETAAGYRLSGEQRAVLERLCTGGHGIDAVIGVAGSGKTTIMSVLRAAHEAAGHTVAGASTAAVAAANLAAESGIASTTIAKWLARIDAGLGLAGVDVLVVDESAMVDDRAMATLVDAAAAAGTQIVGIGDPLQLRAVGVGGTFAAVHRLVAGEQLTENRRQRDQTERDALATWRTGDRRGALRIYADAGHVHAVDDAAAAHATMLQLWHQVRGDWTDPHDRIEQLLMLAGTNTDVDALNTAAQAVRTHAGELTGPGRTYRLAGGGQLRLHVGDQVLLRRNDYRAARTGGEHADVLNGYRGIVTNIARDGTVAVTWRAAGADGPRLVTEQVTPTYVAAGGLTLGYALTVAKAQGLSAERTVVYGAGLDAHTLYPALSRDRGRVDLVLPRTLLESDETRVRLGEPTTPAEALRRAVDAYAAALERDRADRLVATELGDRLDEPGGKDAATSGNPAPVPAWWQRGRAGAYTDTELAAAVRTAQARLGAAERRTAGHRAQADAAARAREAARGGRGPHATTLAHRLQLLVDVVRHSRTAEQHTATATTAQQRLNTTSGQERELYQQLRRSRLALRLTGTSRDQVRDQLTQLQHTRTGDIQARDTARRDAHIAHTDASVAARDAGLPLSLWANADPATLTAHAEAAARSAEQQRDAAIVADVADADRRHPTPTPDTTAAASSQVDAARTQLQQLKAEAELRTRMDPHTRTTETTDRDQARHQARTGRRGRTGDQRSDLAHKVQAAVDAVRRRQAAARRNDDEYLRRRHWERPGPTHDHGGPSIGR